MKQLNKPSIDSLLKQSTNIELITAKKMGATIEEYSPAPIYKNIIKNDIDLFYVLYKLGQNKVNIQNSVSGVSNYCYLIETIHNLENSDAMNYQNYLLIFNSWDYLYDFKLYRFYVDDTKDKEYYSHNECKNIIEFINEISSLLCITNTTQINISLFEYNSPFQNEILPKISQSFSEIYNKKNTRIYDNELLNISYIKYNIFTLNQIEKFDLSNNSEKLNRFAKMMRQIYFKKDYKMFLKLNTTNKLNAK